MHFFQHHYKWIGERWKQIPKYIDYLDGNHRTNKTPAIVVDIDGTIKPAHPLLDYVDLFEHVRDAFKQISERQVDIICL